MRLAAALTLFHLLLLALEGWSNVSNRRGSQHLVSIALPI